MAEGDAPEEEALPDGAFLAADLPVAGRAGVGLPGPPRLPEPFDAPDSAMARG